MEKALRTEGEAVDKSPLRSTDTEAWRDRSPWRPKALTAEDAERADRGLRGRELVEKSYCLGAIYGYASGSWDQIADQVLAACRA